MAAKLPSASSGHKIIFLFAQHQEINPLHHDEEESFYGKQLPENGN
jgi:hypothetical protein